MAIRRSKKVAAPAQKPKPAAKKAVLADDPLPEDTYGETRWADLQATGYIWYPDLRRAIYDRGQAAETVAQPGR